MKEIHDSNTNIQEYLDDFEKPFQDSDDGFSSWLNSLDEDDNHDPGHRREFARMHMRCVAEHTMPEALAQHN